MKKLTAAQLNNLKAIRAVGGVIEQDRYGFHKPGEKACISGMNAVAVRSLIEIGRLTLTAGEDSNTIAIAHETQLTPSHVAALKWQRERFGGNK